MRANLKTDEGRVKSKQLILDLPVSTTYRYDDFFISPSNEMAFNFINGRGVTQNKGWPNGRLLLIGPSGSGKTHLASLWSKKVDAITFEAKYLTLESVSKLMKEDDRSCCHIVVENAEQAAGNIQAEEALFHLYNMVSSYITREETHYHRALYTPHLLITSSCPVRDWGLGLSDLKSRMEAMMLVSILMPDEALLGAVLLKLFADRQVNVTPQLVNYIIPRIERSVDAVRSLVEKLDREALIQGKAISRSLAAEVLSQGFENNKTTRRID